MEREQDDSGWGYSWSRLCRAMVRVILGMKMHDSKPQDQTFLARMIQLRSAPPGICKGGRAGVIWEGMPLYPPPFLSAVPSSWLGSLRPP